MKTASQALIDLLATGEFYVAELYTFTLTSGAVYRYTGADVDITMGGNTFKSMSLERGDIKTVIGVEVDTLSVTFYAGPYDMVAGISFIKAARTGVFDMADLVVERLYMKTWGDTSAGTLILFTGAVAPGKYDRISAEFTVKSHFALLNVNMPRNLYQPTCVHMLYDQGCGLNASSFAVSGSVLNGSTASNLLTNLTNPLDYFTLGKVVFTSGVNNGVLRTVKKYQSGGCGLIRPLPAMPGAGDTFLAYPGCDRLQATCSGKFNNLPNFRGMPYVPVPETAL